MDNTLQNIAIGVDIGGSHITAVAVDMTNHTIIEGSRAESPVDNKAQANDILNVWADTLRKVLRNVPVFRLRGIGVAMPGPFDYPKGICLIRESISMRICTVSMSAVLLVQGSDCPVTARCGS
ncbi:MAG: hypothetical protein MZV63_05175 [Marinilabiliales bacterium]|nr:hypothetical protein [Marinilabiliales bacterium]